MDDSDAAGAYLVYKILLFLIASLLNLPLEVRESLAGVGEKWVVRGS